MSNNPPPDTPDFENQPEQMNTRESDSECNTSSDAAANPTEDSAFETEQGPRATQDTNAVTDPTSTATNADVTAPDGSNTAEPPNFAPGGAQETPDSPAALNGGDTTPPRPEKLNSPKGIKQETAAAVFVGKPFADREEVYLLANEFVFARQIVTRYDGTCFTDQGPQVATRRDEIGPVLKREDVDERWLVDEFMMETKARGIKVKKSEVVRAVRKILNRARLNRRFEVLSPILQALSGPILEKARAEWLRLSRIFEMDSELCIAILQHHIWQVLSKQLSRPIAHHLMAIVFSRMQGSGKTTFAQKFHAPIEKLATGPVVLSDFIDTRNADVYRFPVIIVDDVGQIAPKMVPILKSLVTANVIRRRKMGTSDSLGVRQMTTLFGTANTPIEELVPDSTGHRRFVTLPFANGAVDRGGDPEVWKIVAETDYALLWRSVDAFGPTPLATKLHLLYAHQEAMAPVSPLKEWLLALDLNSEGVKNITTRHGIRANSLHELFVLHTGSDMTAKSFGLEVKRLLNQPGVPFSAYDRQADGRFYKLKCS